ncbi:response regulator transcription factor [Nonomuraea rubra]|uniref:DNA-binding NarL/FixJ family response regulator n=1 Tax=Nonomuraea rubra TaxID=46180 RepID=A0A7X0NLX4_9ACTN|nr:response regulator transcription factor [Nonomuraea rubra]MBB6545824.1 DNA-binding NarL/FixJ family response regulator [Nonomuraea rubra]
MTAASPSRRRAAPWGRERAAIPCCPPAHRETITVVVAGDQELGRARVAALIRGARGLEVAGEAATAEEAAGIRAEVALLYARAPGAVAATRVLAGGEPKVLVLGEREEIGGYARAVLRAGAAGLLPRDTPPARVLSAIRAVAAGDVVLARAVVEALTESPLDEAPGPGVLTRREAEVIALVARALSNEDIAAYLWISEATVKTHLNRVMAKLGLSSRAHVVAYAYDRGLVRPSP